MAYGPEGIQPSYAFQQAAMPKAGSTLNTIGKHVIGGGLSALGGGLGAYGLRQGMLQQQADLKAQEAAQQQANKANLPQSGPNTQMQQPGQINSQQQLSDLLSQLTSRKLDTMYSAGQQAPTQPKMLLNQAFQASNQQSGSQQAGPQQAPPSWLSEAPKFAFEQMLGGGADYNPFSGLGDVGQDEPAPDKSMWRQGANLLGKGLQAAAPLGAFLGPLGWLGGAAAGLGGYGLQQL